MKRMKADPAYWRIRNAIGDEHSALIDPDEHAAGVWRVVERARKRARVAPPSLARRAAA